MRKSARRTVASLVAVVSLSALAFGVSPGMADSPHFLKATASLDSSGNLICAFKEAGLGTTVSTANVSCSASASATYACINGGGNHPQAANKETVTAPVTGGGTFPVRNGSVTGSITVAPPGPGNFSCPGGQRLVLAGVSYSGITVSGEGATTSTTPSQLSATFFPL
jgi:hypothetical protein